MRTGPIRIGAAVAVSVSAALVFSSPAFADNVVFEVTPDNAVTVDGSTISVAPGNAVTAQYRITPSGGDGGPDGGGTQRYCNAADGTPATVTILTPAEVTAVPSVLTFTSCDYFQAVTFTSDTPGSYAIAESVVDAGPGGYKDQAHFTLTVTGAATVTNQPEPVLDTTPPTVTVTAQRSTDHNGWYNRPVAFAATADEPATCEPVATYSGPDNGSATVALSCVDLAGNVGNGAVSFPYDATAPSLAPRVSSGTVPLNGSATVTANEADTLSGVAARSCDTVTTAAVGARSVGCSAADLAGNSATGAASYSVVYRTNGVLQPINADGSSVFQLGRTVPVKFQALDANGVAIGTPGVVSGFKLVATGTNTLLAVNEEPISTTPDTAFRYDATSGQWIYNLSTKNLKSATKYRYEIRLNDGVTVIPFAFAVK